MSTLVLRLSGPMQSWGTSSRFVYRATDPQPSKSGIIGLLAAALGRRRSDPIEDLLKLKFGVRIDQEGRVMRDFHTARTLDGSETMPLSERFYLADAVFLAAVEGPDSFIIDLDNALKAPYFPLYLGRRACIPIGQVTQGVRNKTLRNTLDTEPWVASKTFRKKAKKEIELQVLADAEYADDNSFMKNDLPISFDPQWRQFQTRLVTRYWITISNPDSNVDENISYGINGHDPFGMLGGH